VAVMSTIPGHNRVTQSRNQTALGGHGRTRRIGIRDPGSLTVRNASVPCFSIVAPAPQGPPELNYSQHDNP